MLDVIEELYRDFDRAYMRGSKSEAKAILVLIRRLEGE